MLVLLFVALRFLQPEALTRPSIDLSVDLWFQVPPMLQPVVNLNSFFAPAGRAERGRVARGAGGGKATGRAPRNDPSALAEPGTHPLICSRGTPCRADHRDSCSCGKWPARAPQAHWPSFAAARARALAWRSGVDATRVQDTLRRTRNTEARPGIVGEVYEHTAMRCACTCTLSSQALRATRRSMVSAGMVTVGC